MRQASERRRQPTPAASAASRPPRPRPRHGSCSTHLLTRLVGQAFVSWPVRGCRAARGGGVTQPIPRRPETRVPPALPRRRRAGAGAGAGPCVGSHGLVCPSLRPQRWTRGMRLAVSAVARYLWPAASALLCCACIAIAKGGAPALTHCLSRPSPSISVFILILTVGSRQTGDAPGGRRSVGSWRLACARGLCGRTT